MFTQTTHAHPHTYTQLGGIGRESESDDSELAQTLIEIDYETAIDDEDVVDEFLVFKRTLHSKCYFVIYIYIIRALCVVLYTLVPLT